MVVSRVEPVYEYPVARAAHQRQSQVFRQANHQSQHSNNQHRQVSILGLDLAEMKLIFNYANRKSPTSFYHYP